MSVDVHNVFVHKDNYYEELDTFYNGKKIANINITLNY